jgi:hypothetical protein
MPFMQVQSLDGLPDMLAIISSLPISFRLDHFNPSVTLGFSFKQLPMTKGV